MAYTVKQLATLSGVSIRTLHHYDETDLLPPAYIGRNGYRFYEEEQLLSLQQILFYRELGLSLLQIKDILQRSDFDKIAALSAHKKALREQVGRTQQLIVTIDKTIKHLKGKQLMREEELFEGFDRQKQAQYEAELVDRYGGEMKQKIAESKSRIKGWSKEKWAATQGDFESICQDLTAALQAEQPTDGETVQAIVGRHFHWLSQFWTPNKESYAGHGQFIVETELRQAYEKHHAELPEYLAAGIQTYAEREL